MLQNSTNMLRLAHRGNEPLVISTLVLSITLIHPNKTTLNLTKLRHLNRHCNIPKSEVETQLKLTSTSRRPTKRSSSLRMNMKLYVTRKSPQLRSVDLEIRRQRSKQESRRKRIFRALRLSKKANQQSVSSSCPSL